MIGGGLFDIFPSIEDTSTKQAMQGFQVLLFQFYSKI